MSKNIKMLSKSVISTRVNTCLLVFYMKNPSLTERWVQYNGSMKIDSYTDKEIVKAVLNRDAFVTKEYLYRKCHPLFKSIYDKYYTDCDSWSELVNEIYVYIMIPSKETGISKLAAFQFRCTLTTWLKVVTENYCHQLYAKKVDIIGDNSDDTDIFNHIEYSLNIDLRSIDMSDVRKLLELMPNQRYRKLIEYRYVYEHSNEETAALMSMTMANYYNKHKLAKAQFAAALRKEGLA